VAGALGFHPRDAGSIPAARSKIMIDRLKKVRKIFEEHRDIYAKRKYLAETVSGPDIAAIHTGIIKMIEDVEEELSDLRGRIQQLEDRVPDRWDRGL
jgi:hypothetical protein